MLLFGLISGLVLGEFFTCVLLAFIVEHKNEKKRRLKALNLKVKGK